MVGNCCTTQRETFLADYQHLRKCISNNDDEIIIYGAESVLYDGNKLGSIFPFDCNALPFTGDFAVVLLAEDLDHIAYLEESLK